MRIAWKGLASDQRMAMRSIPLYLRTAGHAPLLPFAGCGLHAMGVLARAPCLHCPLIDCPAPRCPLPAEYCCNGTVIEDEELGKVLQLQGDQRKVRAAAGWPLRCLESALHRV